MTNSPTVSVVMSVFNTEFHLVKRAIDSVLNQTLQNFELIVVDDGSSKENAQLMLEYCILNQQKISYIRHSNCGQSLSVNKAVLICKGQYVSFLDADDEYISNHLEKCLESVEGNDLISSKTHTIVNTNDDYYVPDKFNSFLMVHVDDCILFATLFGKINVFRQLQFKNMYAADADFYARASELFSVKRCDIRTYVYYRNMPNSVSATLKKNQLLAST